MVLITNDTVININGILLNFRTTIGFPRMGASIMGMYDAIVIPINPIAIK